MGFKVFSLHHWVVDGIVDGRVIAMKMTRRFQISWLAAAADDGRSRLFAGQ